MFTLAISCLTTSNSPRFMDLTFQVPMQYCSLQHQTLLPSPVTSTTGHCFCFRSAFHSFWSYFSHSSPVAYGHTTRGVHFSASYLFCLFILFMRFSGQEYWRCLPFPSPVNHILLELSTMTHPSWVALHSMTCSFIKLHKVVIHVIILASFLWSWFSFCLPSDGWR